MLEGNHVVQQEYCVCCVADCQFELQPFKNKIKQNKIKTLDPDDVNNKQLLGDPALFFGF